MACAGVWWMGVCILAAATLAHGRANSSTYENDFPLSADYVGSQHVVVSWAGDAGNYTVNIKKGEGDRPTNYACTKDITCSGGTCTFDSKNKTTECANLGSCRNIVVEAVGPSSTSQPLKLTTAPANGGHKLNVTMNNTKMTVAWYVATSGEYSPCTTSTTVTITTPHHNYTYTNDTLPSGGNVRVTHEQTMGPCDKGSATVLVEIRGGDGVADHTDSVIKKNYDVTTVTSPDPPQNVNVTAVLNKPDQLNVTWTKSDLPCTVTYQVTWSHSGTEVENRIVNDAEQYIIRNLDTYTQYEVCVQAKVDGSDLSAKICKNETTDEDIPDPPVNVEIYNAQDTELTVSWEPPTTPNGVITNYSVTWHYDGGDDANDYTIVTNYTIPNLTPCTPYIISVTAATSKGWGFATSGVTHDTTGGVPSAPSSVSAAMVRDHSDELSVKWKAGVPQYPSCTVSHTVSWSQAGSLIHTANATKPDQYTITGLQAYTNYTVCVTAWTTPGIQSKEMCTNARTDEDIPGPPDNVTISNAQNSQLTVLWDPPNTPNGVITNYRITWQHDGGANASHDTANTTYTIPGLTPCTPYTISVTASTSKGWGIATSGVTHNTAAGAPNATSSVKAVIVLDHSDELNVTWVAGVAPGPLCTVSHTVSWSQAGSLIDTANATEPDQYTITGLKAYTTYTVCVTAWTTPELQSKVVCTNGHTDEDIPGSPVNVRVNNTQDTELTIAWDPPTTPNGVITDYNVTWHYDGGDDANNYTVDTTYTIPDLTPCTNYTISVTAATSKGWGSATSDVTYETAAGAPSGPTVKDCALNSEGNMISLNWDQIKTTCTISGYYVNYIGDVLWNDTQVNRTVKTTGDYYDLVGLTYWTHYTVYIAAIATGVTGDVVGQYSCCCIQTTHEGAPGQPSSAHSSSSSSSSVTVVWAAPVEANGNITGYQVSCGEEAEAETTSGTSFTCNDLQPDMLYTISIKALNGAGPGKAAVVEGHTKGSGNVGAIVGGVIGALAGVGVMVLALYIGRHRIKNHFNQTTSPSKTSISDNKGTAMTKTQLRKYTAQLEANRQYLESEFQILKEKSPDHPKEAASASYNRYKNRFVNILPYDKTRVKLKEVAGTPGSDYINANYIKDVNRKNMFIASQGPKPDTMADFWQMVWEQRVNTIVVLTRLVENGKDKCSQYWPGVLEGPMQCGHLAVTCHNENRGELFIKRLLEVSTPTQKRVMNQYHFTAWPDFKAPEREELLLELIAAVRSATKGQTSPIVVHCSAGVGRTGTFIGLWNLIDECKRNPDAGVDVQRTILNMREARNIMVQSQEQYLYLFKCITFYLDNPQRWDNIADDEDGVYENAGYENSDYENIEIKTR